MSVNDVVSLLTAAGVFLTAVGQLRTKRQVSNVADKVDETHKAVTDANSTTNAQ